MRHKSLICEIFFTKFCLTWLNILPKKNRRMQSWRSIATCRCLIKMTVTHHLRRGCFFKCHSQCREIHHRMNACSWHQRCVLTLHHSDGVFYLRFEQVDPHHCSQVLHIHLVHTGVQLHLKQEPTKRKSVLLAVTGHTDLSTAQGMLCAPASAHRRT